MNSQNIIKNEFIKSEIWNLRQFIYAISVSDLSKKEIFFVLDMDKKGYITHSDINNANTSVSGPKDPLNLTDDEQKVVVVALDLYKSISRLVFSQTGNIISQRSEKRFLTKKLIMETYLSAYNYAKLIGN